MSDADMKDESGVSGTQETMLDLHKTTLPEGGMIWDPVSKSYVTRDGKPQPLQTQVPGTPDPGSIDFQEKTKNPLFEGVFAAYRDDPLWQSLFNTCRNCKAPRKGSADRCSTCGHRFKETDVRGDYNREMQRRENEEANAGPDFDVHVGNATARQYLDAADQFDNQADGAGNRELERHWRAKADYYRRLAEQYQANDPAQQQVINGAPDASSNTDVYMDVADKPTINNTDNSFPSMISATTPEVTSTMLNTGKNSWSADDAHRSALGDSPTLANCPNDCGGMMTDHQGESVCHDCGHKEKIHYADKQAGLLDLAGPAAGMGMALDVVAPEIGIPLQAASLMGKVMGQGGGGGQAGSETPTAGAGSAAADDAMHMGSSVEDGDSGTNGYENSGHDSEPDSGNKGSEAQDMAADELDSDNDGDAGGSDSMHGLDPNLIFEVFGPHLESIADNDDSHNDPIAKAVHEVFKQIDPDYLNKAARFEISKLAGGTCPTCHIDLTTAQQCGMQDATVACPVGLPKSGQQMTQTLPGMSAISPSTMGQPMSHVLASDEDGFEITSGRRPKMCPAHDALVTYALTLGDPAAAVQALSGELFGANSCAGGHELFNKNDQPTKCRYKPEMIKQEYWDAKDAAAEERKLQREQQQALLDQQIMAPQPLDLPPAPPVPEPEGQLIGGPEYDAQMEQAEEEKLPVTQDIPDVSGLSTEEDYIPAEQGEDTTFPAEWAKPVAEIPVHAKIKWSGGIVAQPPVESPEQMFTDSPPEEQISDDSAGLMHEGVLDSDGNPLKVGLSYEVHNPTNTDFIPDVYEITAEDSNLIQFEVKSDVENGEPFSFTDSLPVDQIKAEGLTFVPTSDAPNASGDVAPNTDDDNTKGSDVPGQVSDLDTGGNSHASKVGNDQMSDYEGGIPGEPSLSDEREYQPSDPAALEAENAKLRALLQELGYDGDLGAPADPFDYGPGRVSGDPEEELYSGDEIPGYDRFGSAPVLEGKPEFDWLNEDGDQGIHTAGRDFSLGEQRSFVNESGEARNLDKLDLSGTHYPEGSNDPFDDSALFM